jgi:selenide, water dikinase
VSERRRIDVRLTAQVACAGCAAKLGPADLRGALSGLPRPPRDRRVLVDHSTLDDAGVFAFGRGEALVQTVDFFTPILDDPYDFGQVAAANSVSDVYAMGGTPITALAVLCFPDGALGPEVLREILRGGQDKMKEAGASILGGHTVRDPELKFGYSVTGTVQRRHLLTNAGARPGDRLVLSKPLGTGVLATALKQQRLDDRGRARLTRSMATLNRAASEAAVEFGARAATDITGFSLLGHASQLADASGVTLRMTPRADWFLPRVLDFVRAGTAPGGLARNREFYGPGVDLGPIDPAWRDALFDPQTSGGLLVALPSRRASAFLGALARRRVWHVEVGEVVARASHAVVLSPS